MIEILAPRAPSPGEAVELQVATRLPPGARLLILDRDGHLLGAVTPFGPGQDNQTATVPIDRSLLNGRALKLQLQVSQPGLAVRSPSADEVGRLNLIITPGPSD